MKNLLLTICILLMFGMSWLTFSEMKEFQMKVDTLIERVEAIEEDAEYVDLEEKRIRSANRGCEGKTINIVITKNINHI